MGGVTGVVAGLLLAVSPVQFLQAHAADGAFSEPHGTADASLTSWAVLGLSAAGATAPGSLAYLQAQESTLAATTDVALVALAEEALGARPAALLDRLRSAVRPTGQVGPTVNSTCWAVLALGRSTRGDDTLAAGAAGAERRVRVGDPRAAGLERHRGGTRGAAGRRRARGAG